MLKQSKDGDECFALILGEGMTSRYNKRELADSIKVEKLYKDTFKAGKIVGYKNFIWKNYQTIDLIQFLY
ncbi:hypothetical protein [Clostridium sporogenes]|uniref:hypothetical protein n=1 Tax=Clostridium sporogenes TaxID=1509 RepID=UPI00311A829A